MANINKKSYTKVPKHTLSVKYLKMALGEALYYELLGMYMEAKKVAYLGVYAEKQHKEKQERKQKSS